MLKDNTMTFYGINNLFSLASLYYEEKGGHLLRIPIRPPQTILSIGVTKMNKSVPVLK